MTVHKSIYDALIPVEKAKPDLPEEWFSVDDEKYRISHEVLGFDSENMDFFVCTYMEVQIGSQIERCFMDKVGYLVLITHWLPLYVSEKKNP